jgi:uncharacterized protein YkwD
LSKTPRVRIARTKCLAAVAVTLVSGLGLSLGAASAAGRGCGDATAAAARLPLSSARAAVQCLVNEQRAAHGLPPLRNSARLAYSAQRWVKDLVATGLFDHGDLAARVRSVGVRFAVAGEDLGTGQATPMQIVAAWMASPDHCRNILSPTFSEFGAGVSPHPIRGWATGPSTWAEDFALPLRHRAPSHNWGPANGCPYGGG